MVSDRIDGDSHPPAPKPRREFLLRDPDLEPRRRRRSRAALLFLSVALVTIVAAVTARFVGAQWIINQSYTHWMMVDLERLIAEQSTFHAEHGRYATQGELGVRFVPSQGVHVTIAAADESGWNAYATHLRSTERCLVTVGTGASVIRNVPSGKPACASS